MGFGFAARAHNVVGVVDWIAACIEATTATPAGGAIDPSAARRPARLTPSTPVLFGRAEAGVSRYARAGPGPPRSARAAGFVERFVSGKMSGVYGQTTIQALIRADCWRLSLSRVSRASSTKPRRSSGVMGGRSGAPWPRAAA